MAGAGDTELSVRSESIQSLYSRYLGDRFAVNRRYQRKLVWSVEEKQRLIDSVLQNLPVPLFLIAETTTNAEVSYEVIDGMQRLNALFSFLENEFPVNGAYFDLDALADTKSRKDAGTLQQLEPVMPRDRAVQLSNYSVALSVFRATSSNSVDEVFRRINSGGRQLSYQELRQAGTISTLADLVRVISSKVRGDTSPGDIVPLQKMPQLSITSRDLDYGVNVDSIFWVRHGILRRDDVRTSQDEQLVLDLIIDCVIDPIPTIGKDVRDEYYDYTVEDETERPTEIAAAIEAYGREELERDFLATFDLIRTLVDGGSHRFATLIGVQSGGRSPRYYHGLFIACFELMFKDRLRPKDAGEVTKRLQGISSGALNVPAGGGNWATEPKRATIDAVKGVLRSAFEDIGEGDDYARYGWATQLETLLGNAIVEQQLFECKQGLHRVKGARIFDEELLNRIYATATGMANMGRDAVGYITIGIADDASAAQVIATEDAISPVEFRGFHIVGLEREAALRGSSLGDYWKWIVQRLRSAQTLDPRLRAQMAADARLAHYRGFSVAVVKVLPVGEPVFYDGKLYERVGSETTELPPTNFGRVFGRFIPTGAAT